MTDNIVYVLISITPDQIEEKKYKCNYEECLKDFTNENSLKKHVLLIHYKITSADEKLKKIVYRYACPIEQCKRNIQKDFFSSRKYLIQHFYKSHNSEKFNCGNGCSLKFSTELLMKIHMRCCGQIFTCDFCNCVYNSNEALLTHRKRKNHFDQSVEIKKRKIENKLKSVGTNTIKSNDVTLLSKSTTTDDQLVMPKVSSSTSTAEDFMKEENSNSLSSSSSQKKGVTWNASNDEFEEDTITLFDSTETQTDLNESFFSNNFMSSFTQTTFADFDDFGKYDGQTQTNWDEF